MASDSWARFDPDEYSAAVSAVAQRIIPNRRRMTLEDAEDIVRMEFERQGVPLSRAQQEFHARWFHRSPWWAFLHPWQARHEGVSLGWRWGKRENDFSPLSVAVMNLANEEAWRLTGNGRGPLSAELEPAECERISRTEYFCVAEVRASNRHPAHRVEITVSCRRGGSPRVIDGVVRSL